MSLAIKKVTAICNGVEQQVPYNAEQGKYVLTTFTAPSKSSYNLPDHVYVITIKAEDEAGNVATQETTLRVKELVKPVSVFVSPDEGALLRTTQPLITWKVTDDDSGVNPDTIGITFDNGNKITDGITKTTITGGYQCSYAPLDVLSQGTHTVKVDCTDHDGNVATQVSRSFVCDTVNPILTVTAPVYDLTKIPSCTFSGTATDVTTAPCRVTIKHNLYDVIDVPVSDSGAWTKAFTLDEGDNTFAITAYDRAGNETLINKQVKLDTIAPTIVSIEIDPDPVNANSTFTIKVDAND